MLGACGTLDYLSKYKKKHPTMVVRQFPTDPLQLYAGQVTITRAFNLISSLYPELLKGEESCYLENIFVEIKIDLKIQIYLICVRSRYITPLFQCGGFLCVGIRPANQSCVSQPCSLLSQSTGVTMNTKNTLQNTLLATETQCAAGTKRVCASHCL